MDYRPHVWMNDECDHHIRYFYKQGIRQPDGRVFELSKVPVCDVYGRIHYQNVEVDATCYASNLSASPSE